jgi:hypothetical protein
MQHSSNPVLAIILTAAGIAAASSLYAAESTNADAVGATEGTSGAASANDTDTAVNPERGRFGLGVIAGEPTGLTMKYWFSDVTAMDLGAAWSFEDEDSFQLHGDFLFHKFDLFRVDHGELPLYFGVGGRVKIPEHGDTRVGIRIPVGISYLFEDMPIEVFGEIVPVVDVAPSTEFRLNGGIGVRYYFR